MLDGIGLGDTRELLVFNQIDRLPREVGQAIASRMGGVAVSALRSEGLTELLSRAEGMLWDRAVRDRNERVAQGGSE